MPGTKNLKNRKRFAKVEMSSKGVLIFAWVSGEMPYQRIADTAAGLVKKFLDLPTTIVTNIGPEDYEFKHADQVIVKPMPPASGYRDFGGAVIPWVNGNRGSAYDITPYDQTLLIDADYYIFSDELRQLFDTDLEFACYDEICDVLGGSLAEGHRRIGPNSIKMQWATVIYFTKNKIAESIFEFMGVVKDNWDFYKMLYGFHGYRYRNDFALSIALQSLTGFGEHNFSKIPGKLMTVDMDSHVYQIEPDTKIVVSNNQGVKFLRHTSLHFFNKKDLMGDRLTSECEQVINA